MTYLNNVFLFNIDINSLSEKSIKEIDIILNHLHSLTSSGILSFTDAEKYRNILMKAKEKQILESYPIRIWKASNGTWKAHIPDDSKKYKRRTIQGVTRENLEKRILSDFYQHCDERLLFKNYFPYWLLEYKATYVKGGTLQRNYNDYKKFIQNKPIDSMRITDITSLDIRKFLNSTINEYHLTRRAFNNLNSIFNGMFAYATEIGDIANNPTLNVCIKSTNMRPEKAKTGKTEVFNKEETRLLVNYIFDHYLEIQPMISLAILLNFQLGLRVGELCTLMKKDIFLEEHLICINRTERSYKPLELVDGKIVEHTTVHIITDGDTKKHSNRTLPLSNEAISIIKECLKYQEENHINSEFLFANKDGNHILRERFNEILKHYCKKVSIDVKSIHKTRKTVLSRLFESGLGLDEVMQMSGHRDKNTLVKHYLYTMNDMENQRERISSALSSGHTFAN